MKQSDAIFAFQSEHHNSQRLWSWLTALATAASAVLLCYAFLDAVGGFPDPLYAVIAIVTVTLEAAFLPRKMGFIILNVLIGAVVIMLAAINFPTYLNGGFLMLNRTYTASQDAQSYVYQMMEVTLDEQLYPFAEFCFNGITLLAFSAILSYYSLKKIPFLPIVMLFVTAVSEEYFGVAPTPALNVALFLSLLCLVMVSGYKGSTVHGKTLWQAGIAVVLLAAVLLSSTFFIYPTRYHEHNPYVDEINEAIRDWLDKDEEELPEDQQDSDNHLNTVENKEADTQSEEERDPETAPAQEEPEDMSDVDDPENNNTENGASANQKPEEGEGGREGIQAQDEKKRPQEESVVLHLWILFPLLLLLLAILIWAAIVLAAASKRKKKLSDGDNNAVMQYAFSQSVKWLRGVGLPKENVPQSALINDVRQLFDADYAAQYETAVNAWQESLYSNRSMEDYRKEEMLTYYALTKKNAWQKAGLWKKLHIKLIDLL